MRILCNDYHVNLLEEEGVPQGGPSRFSIEFHRYIGNRKNITLIPVFFTHLDAQKKVAHKVTSKGKLTYHELIFDKAILSASYNKPYSKAEYVLFLQPWILQVQEVMLTEKPDIVFLNGYSLSNWILMEAAYRLGIPVCIQHAGIWKKELELCKDKYSSSIRRIFNSFEKETIEKCSKHIFLNQWSLDVFIQLHAVTKKKEILKKTTIVPLPVELHNTHPYILNVKKGRSGRIGSIARSDSIKNHTAILRMAKYIHSQKIPFQISCVTKPFLQKNSHFLAAYQKEVEIIPQMTPQKLGSFYASCDIVLVPSRFDVSPTVVVEAIGAGVPVVISSSTGWVTVFKMYALERCIISPAASGKAIIAAIDFALTPMAKTRFSEMQKYIKKAHAPSKVFDVYYDTFTHIISHI